MKYYHKLLLINKLLVISKIISKMITMIVTSSPLFKMVFSMANSYELVEPNIVPNSSTTASFARGLTSCPKALSSGQSALTKIL